MHVISRRLRTIVLGFLVLTGVAVSAACGRGQPGPTARPDAVVGAAPDITLAAGSAVAVGRAPGVSASGRVVFATGAATLAAEPPPTSPPPFGVLEPAAVVDLLRGVVRVRAYGGVEVQGVGTKRYEVDVDLARSLRNTPPPRRAPLRVLHGRLGADGQVWADVFVDAQGRIRRVLLPVTLTSNRPFGTDPSFPALVSVDYSDFGRTS